MSDPADPSPFGGGLALHALFQAALAGMNFPATFLR
ncbi:hypothetical protein RLEG12_20120 [Rhizobium leguminosarum bv. trifolii CB782]|nr:hypothetical protein RLEG12_20120 [Rhizobium leguminosarum bv. trifolii CB782]